MYSKYWILKNKNCEKSYKKKPHRVLYLHFFQFFSLCFQAYRVSGERQLSIFSGKTYGWVFYLAYKSGPFGIHPQVSYLHHPRQTQLFSHAEAGISRITWSASTFSNTAKNWSETSKESIYLPNIKWTNAARARVWKMALVLHICLILSLKQPHRIAGKQKANSSSAYLLRAHKSQEVFWHLASSFNLFLGMKSSAWAARMFLESKRSSSNNRHSSTHSSRYLGLIVIASSVSSSRIASSNRQNTFLMNWARNILFLLLARRSSLYVWNTWPRKP